MNSMTKDTRLHIRCDQDARRLLDKAAAYAHMGRVRACTADGASVSGDRPGPRCSDWSE